MNQIEENKRRDWRELFRAIRSLDNQLLGRKRKLLRKKLGELRRKESKITKAIQAHSALKASYVGLRKEYERMLQTTVEKMAFKEPPDPTFRDRQEMVNTFTSLQQKYAEKADMEMEM